MSKIKEFSEYCAVGGRRLFGPILPQPRLRLRLTLGDAAHMKIADLVSILLQVQNGNLKGTYKTATSETKMRNVSGRFEEVVNLYSIMISLLSCDNGSWTPIKGDLGERIDFSAVTVLPTSWNAKTLSTNI
jgi:hypothetical protein